MQESGCGNLMRFVVHIFLPHQTEALILNYVTSTTSISVGGKVKPNNWGNEAMARWQMRESMSLGWAWALGKISPAQCSCRFHRHNLPNCYHHHNHHREVLTSWWSAFRLLSSRLSWDLLPSEPEPKPTVRSWASNLICLHLMRNSPFLVRL